MTRNFVTVLRYGSARFHDLNSVYEPSMLRFTDF